jgi:hypothetical protein
MICGVTPAILAIIQTKSSQIKSCQAQLWNKGSRLPPSSSLFEHRVSRQKSRRQGERLRTLQYELG